MHQMLLAFIIQFEYDEDIETSKFDFLIEILKKFTWWCVRVASRDL